MGALAERLQPQRRLGRLRSGDVLAHVQEGVALDLEGPQQKAA